MTTREALHRLIDAVPESELESVRFLLEQRHRLHRDPFLLAPATAPDDDEPETPEEAAAVAEARKAIARGEVVTLDEVRRELGLRPGPSG